MQRPWAAATWSERARGCPAECSFALTVMADTDEMDRKPDGELPAENNVGDRKSLRYIEIESATSRKPETFYDVFNRIFSEIFFPDPNSGYASATLVERIKISVCENGPLFREAYGDCSRKLLLWTRQGSPLRALLVIVVGTIILVASSGLLVFMLFFLAATINAVIISLLVSLAAAGGFLALSFACITAIYIGALSVSLFVISSATVLTIIALLIATGWIGFFWVVWLVTKKSMGLASHTMSVAGSAISSYSSAGKAHHCQAKKFTD